MNRTTHKSVRRLAALVMAITIYTLTTSQILAAVVRVTDPVFGADSVIRDIDHGRDFLALVFTMGYGYNGVVANTGIGDAFAGWSVAAQAQLLDLGTSAGIAQGSTDPSQVAKAEELRGWFCISGALSCVNLSTTHEYARGLISDPGPDFPGGIPSQKAFSIGRRFNVTPNEVDFRVSGFGGLADTSEEVFLVRAVPEPSTFLLLGMGVVGLALLSCSQRRRLTARQPA